MRRTAKCAFRVRNGHGAEFLIAQSAQSRADHGLSRQLRFGNAQRYDRELAGLFDLQDEITDTIAGAIEPELGAFERERARRKPPESLDAWDCYQRGLWHIYHHTKEDNADAQRQFRRAIKMDAGFAAAFAGLAYSLYRDFMRGYRKRTSEGLEEAFRFAAQAVAIDDKDPFAHFTLSRICLTMGDRDAAIAEVRTAIELNASFALAHFGLGQTLILFGRSKDAIPEFDRAIQLSPHDPMRFDWEMNKALALIEVREHEEAKNLLRKVIRHPAVRFWAYAHLACALGHLDRPEEARSAVNKLLETRPDFSMRLGHPVKDQAGVEHYIAGLRKAGLDIPDEPAATD